MTKHKGDLPGAIDEWPADESQSERMLGLALFGVCGGVVGAFLGWLVTYIALA